MPGVALAGQDDGAVVLELSVDADPQRILDLARAEGDVVSFGPVAPLARGALPRGGRGVSSAPTDRGTWRLVARRDFWVRIRERSFLVLHADQHRRDLDPRPGARVQRGGAGPSFDLGLRGPARPSQRARHSSATTRSHRSRSRCMPSPTGRPPTQPLRDGSVDAVVDGNELIGFTGIPDVLSSLVEASARNAAVTALLDEHQVPQTERDAANDPTPLVLAVLQPAPPHRSENAAVAFVGVLLLYGQLFGYGIWVASGVIEEKASRVVEMLLSAIRPKQLLLGKIVGIGTLGLAQLIVISSFAIGLAFATNAIDVSSSAFGAAGLVIGWFILGFAFYATLFRGGRIAGDTDGGAAERDRPDQPDDPRLVLHLDRGAAGSERAFTGDRVDPADLLRARDAGADRLGRGSRMADRGVADRPRRLDGPPGAVRGPPVLGRGPADPRAGADPRSLALGRVIRRVPKARRNEGSGSCPTASTRSWKSRNEKAAPSRSRVASRAFSISIIPTM